MAHKQRILFFYWTTVKHHGSWSPDFNTQQYKFEYDVRCCTNDSTYQGFGTRSHHKKSMKELYMIGLFDFFKYSTIFPHRGHCGDYKLYHVDMSLLQLTINRFIASLQLSVLNSKQWFLHVKHIWVQSKSKSITDQPQHTWGWWSDLALQNIYKCI